MIKYFETTEVESKMKVVRDLDLTNYNSYRVHAVVERALFPADENDIRSLYQDDQFKGPKVILGSGHNIILSKEYYKGDFVIFSGNFDNVEVNGAHIKVQAGATMLSLSELAHEHGLSGLEIFYDIPSSVGGAVVMNAGAGGEEIKDLLIKVRYYDPVKDLFAEIEKADMGFEYRNSYFQRNPHLIITEVELELIPGDKTAIREKMENVKETRWGKQPKDLPNAGSVFKRPPGRFVGPMIDELGLKGYSVGGAKVSEKHGGFIVNFDHASGGDILEVISEVKRQVQERFDVDLEVEQRII